jgi:hypothetical protein
LLGRGLGHFGNLKCQSKQARCELYSVAQEAITEQRGGRRRQSHRQQGHIL